MKKQTLFNLASMPKMILSITLIVMLGLLFGAISYLGKIPKIDLPIVKPVIEAQCEVDNDCSLVYVGGACTACSTFDEEYQCLPKKEAAKIEEERQRILIDPEGPQCSLCMPLFEIQHTCKCENGKCEKAKKELVEEVSIRTDKTEYEQGENVSVIIKNNFSEEMSISYPIVERIINDNHIPLKGSVVWPGCGVTGGLIYLPLESSEVVKHQWDQKEKWCSADFSDRNVYSKEILPGKYRIKSEIIKRIKSEKEDPNNISGKPSGEFIYSNEFTIKEKSALDARCGEKVQLFGDCPAYFEEGGYYEFNFKAEKCIEKFIKGSGCNIKTPFKTLEECQEVCEKKECAKEGELINFPVGTNKNLQDVCCEGLKGLAGFGIHKNGECEQLIGGPFLTCMPCGNGICESINNFEENKCNCPEDCE